MERCVNFLHLNIQKMIFKILLLKNQLAKKSVIYVETTSCKVNLKLFNNDRRGQGWAILQNNFRPLAAIFIKKYIEESPLLKNQQARNAETCVEAPLGSLHSSIVKYCQVLSIMNLRGEREATMRRGQIFTQKRKYL